MIALHIFYTVKKEPSNSLKNQNCELNSLFFFTDFGKFKTEVNSRSTDVSLVQDEILENIEPEPSSVNENETEPSTPKRKKKSEPITKQSKTIGKLLFNN